MSDRAYESRFSPGAELRALAGRGAAVTAAFQIGLAFVTLLRGLAVAAFVTRAEYGLWALLALALYVAVAVRAMGVNDRYVQQSDGDQELAFQRAFTVELGFAGAAAVIGAVLVPAFAALTGHDELIVPGLLLLLVLPAGALQFPGWSHYRRMDFRTLRALQAVEPVVATVVTIGLAAAGMGYWSFVIGALAGAWAAALAMLARAVHRPAIRWDPAVARSHLSFSAPYVIAWGATLAIFLVIYLVGEAPLGLAGLGAYTLAGNILAFAGRADAVVTDALYPALCAVRDRTAVLAEAFVKSNRLALLWAVPFGAGLSLFASDLVHFVLGERWAPAIGLLEVMGIVTASQHLGFNWHAFYRARGETWPLAVVGVAGAVAFIAAAVPLMHSHGIGGLAASFAIAEVVSLAMRALFLRRLFPGFRMTAHLLRAMVPTALAAAAVLGVRALETGERTAALAIAEIAGFSLAMVALTLLLERPLLREALGYARRRRG